jgi:hypothetical protein
MSIYVKQNFARFLELFSAQFRAKSNLALYLADFSARCSAPVFRAEARGTAPFL